MKTLVALVLLVAFVAVVHSQCLPGQTFCRGCVGVNTCCPYANAVCCISGLRCCPNGYACDATEQYCIRRNLAGKEIRLPVASSSAAFDAVLMENQNQASAN
ncbi:hypothetical protein L596_010592 [Steinernema carpocapsae]|uniref:Granulins domain-containing protein n=1 Tax=Steinernema carpocapsae TaxID=34508 RepID=A0A4U5PIS5_STECR|nr:hypothetical protein L596_010592 [Steinernema carpocapsae]